MGPKAAGLSRSMGGAVWSPWPWPLSTQAGPYLSLTLILVPSSQSGDSDSVRRFCVQPTIPTKPASPFLRLTAVGKGVRAAGLSITTTWLLGGLIPLTHVCVCELHPHYRSPSITQ